MDKCTMYIVVSSNYSYKDYNIEICYGDFQLRSVLLSHLRRYNLDKCYEDMCLCDLINICEIEGNRRVYDNIGYGIREIREI